MRIFILLPLLGGLLVVAQQSTPGQPVPYSGASQPVTSGSYVLGPNDLVTISVAELPDSTKTYRVDPDGTVPVAFAGRLKAGGLTLTQFEKELTAKLRDQIIDPHVTADIVESHSQPVSVLGEVNTPGMYQLQGGKRLLDVVSMAGGVKKESGQFIQVTRTSAMGKLPVPGAHIHPDDLSTTADINVHDLMDGRHSDLNILMKPYDTVFVPKALVVYVLGDVQKPGPVPLSEASSISAIQAVSLASGFTNTASPQKSRILREVPGQPNRQEIPINLKKLLAGKTEDVEMQPNDILFVPNSRMTRKGIELALETASGFIIWHGI